MREKIILVTGATSGLGESIVKLLASKGHIVYAGFRKKEKIVGTKSSITFIKLDVTSEKQCKQVVADIFKKEGKIDVLINNAGYTLTGPTDRYLVEDYINLLAVNSVAPYRLMKNVLPYMRRQKFGNIINITSLNGMVSMPNFGLYSSSKFALQSLGEAVRFELEGDGIWVTNIVPGAIAGGKRKIAHKTAREKFLLLRIFLPMVTKDSVAKSISKIIKCSKPPMNVILGRDAKVIVFLKRFLPSILWERLMSYVWNK